MNHGIGSGKTGLARSASPSGGKDNGARNGRSDDDEYVVSEEELNAKQAIHEQ